MANTSVVVRSRTMADAIGSQSEPDAPHAAKKEIGQVENFADFVGGVATAGAPAEDAGVGSAPEQSAEEETVTFRAIVSSVSPAAGLPKGSPTFKDGTTTLSTVPITVIGITAYSTAGLAKGSHSITAEYLGTADHLPSTSAVTVQVVK